MPRHRPAWTSDLRATGRDAKDRGILTTPLTKIEDTLRAWADKLPQALAIGLGLMSADPEYAGHLRTAQIGAIIRLTPLTMGASCLNAVILLLTLGRIGSPSLALWIWSALVFALAAHYGRNWWASSTETRIGRRRPGRSDGR